MHLYIYIYYVDFREFISKKQFWFFIFSIQIVSLETGECVGPNMKGEIYVKSMSNMIGYAYDMKKTVNSYNEHDWFKTGDIGYYTDDCCLFIIGRIKELLIYTGLRVKNFFLNKLFDSYYFIIQDQYNLTNAILHLYSIKKKKKLLI